MRLIELIPEEKVLDTLILLFEQRDLHRALHRRKRGETWLVVALKRPYHKNDIAIPITAKSDYWDQHLRCCRLAEMECDSDHEQLFSPVLEALTLSKDLSTTTLVITDGTTRLKRQAHSWLLSLVSEYFSVRLCEDHRWSSEGSSNTLIINEEHPWLFDLFLDVLYGHDYRRYSWAVQLSLLELHQKYLVSYYLNDWLNLPVPKMNVVNYFQRLHELIPLASECDLERCRAMASYEWTVTEIDLSLISDLVLTNLFWSLLLEERNRYSDALNLLLALSPIRQRSFSAADITNVSCTACHPLAVLQHHGEEYRMPEYCLLRNLEENLHPTAC